MENKSYVFDNSYPEVDIEKAVFASENIPELDIDAQYGPLIGDIDSVNFDKVEMGGKKGLMNRVSDKARQILNKVSGFAKESLELAKEVASTVKGYQEKLTAIVGLVTIGSIGFAGSAYAKDPYKEATDAFKRGQQAGNTLPNSPLDACNGLNGAERVECEVSELTNNRSNKKAKKISGATYKVPKGREHLEKNVGNNTGKSKVNKGPRIDASVKGKMLNGKPGIEGEMRIVFDDNFGLRVVGDKVGDGSSFAIAGAYVSPDGFFTVIDAGGMRRKIHIGSEEFKQIQDFILLRLGNVEITELGEIKFGAFIEGAYVNAKDDIQTGKISTVTKVPGGTLYADTYTQTGVKGEKIGFIGGGLTGTKKCEDGSTIGGALSAGAVKSITNNKTTGPYFGGALFLTKPNGNTYDLSVSSINLSGGENSIIAKAGVQKTIIQEGEFLGERFNASIGGDVSIGEGRDGRMFGGTFGLTINWGGSADSYNSAPLVALAVDSYNVAQEQIDLASPFSNHMRHMYVGKKIEGKEFGSEQNFVKDELPPIPPMPDVGISKISGPELEHSSDPNIDYEASNGPSKDLKMAFQLPEGYSFSKDDQYNRSIVVDIEYETAGVVSIVKIPVCDKYGRFVGDITFSIKWN